jgi:hypothetical protein
VFENDLSLTMIGGETPSNITVRLWEVVSSLNPSTEKAETSVSALGTPQTLSTAVPTDPNNALTRQMQVKIDVGLPLPEPASAALSVQPGESLPPADLFRSGRFDRMSASPSEPLEIVMFSAVQITREELLKGLPSVPVEFHERVVNLPGISVTVFATVTAITATLEGDETVAISLEGTLRPGRTAPLVGFAFTAKLAISGSGDEVKPEDVISVVVVPGSEHLTFAGTGSVASELEQAMLNLLSGLILETVSPGLLAQIHQKVNKQAIEQAAQAAGGGHTTPATLPAGVVLSVRQVLIHPAGAVNEGIEIFASLGAFGGVLSKFPQGTSSGGTSSNCALSSMAALPSAQVDLARLRGVRERLLGGEQTERELVHAYYRHSAEAWEMLQRDRRLMLAAQSLLGELQAGRWGLRHHLRALMLARRLARAGSPELRRTIRQTLAARPRRLARVALGSH